MNAGRARYEQIATRLRAKLAAGTYKIGDALPSTAQLAEEYEASAPVIQRALRELKRQGLVEGVPGKGVFVLAAPTPDQFGADADRVAELMVQVEELTARLAEFERRLTVVESGGHS